MMIRMFGAPAGAFWGIYGVQSGTELRTSRLIVPLKSGGALIVGLDWAKASVGQPDTASNRKKALTACPATVATFGRLRIVFRLS
jgi:hypothetical protein